MGLMRSSGLYALRVYALRLGGVLAPTEPLFCSRHPKSRPGVLCWWLGVWRSIDPMSPCGRAGALLGWPGLGGRSSSGSPPSHLPTVLRAATVHDRHIHSRLDQAIYFCLPAARLGSRPNAFVIFIRAEGCPCPASSEQWQPAVQGQGRGAAAWWPEAEDLPAQSTCRSFPRCVRFPPLATVNVTSRQLNSYIRTECCRSHYRRSIS